MKNVLTLLLLALPVLLLQMAFAEGGEESNWRTWTSTKDTKVEGVLVDLKGDEVAIRTKEGHLIKVNANMLSVEDREFIGDFRRKNRLPLVVAYVGGIDGYRARSIRGIAAAGGRDLELKEIPVHNLTNSDDWKRGKIVLSYGQDQLEDFLGQHKEKSERHIVLFASHSILAHAKLAGAYAREVENYRSYGAKNNIPVHVLDVGPLAENSQVRNFDDDGRTPQGANSAMKVFLKNLEGWDLISMPDVRSACLERLENHSDFSWLGPLPDYVMDAVVCSAITGEEPPLLQLKEEVLRKAGMPDPVVVNPANDGLLSHTLSTTSNENLKKLSALIDEVVNR